LIVDVDFSQKNSQRGRGSGVKVSEVEEIPFTLRQLPEDRRDWFVDQMRRMERGEPNAIEGTVPNPYLTA
jgi:hypothetical protein